MNADPSCRPAALRRFRARRSGGAADVRRRARSPRPEAVRRALRAGARAAHAGDQGRLARRRLGPSVRHRVGAQDGDQRSACGARRRPETAALHRDRIAARLSLHRCHGWRVRRNARLPSSGTARAGRAIPPWRPHGIVPRRCRARRPHPRARCHAGTRAACPRRFLAQSASHEALRATPKRSASPADRGDRRPARARTIPASADAVRLLAAARPRGGRAVGLHLAGLHRRRGICTRK